MYRKRICCDKEEHSTGITNKLRMFWLYRHSGAELSEICPSLLQLILFKINETCIHSQVKINVLMSNGLNPYPGDNSVEFIKSFKITMENTHMNI